MIVPLTPLDFKRRAALLFGGKVGVVDGEQRFTYAQFAERTNRLANALPEMGLGPGDRVAFLAFNSYPLLEGYYGVVEAGGILLPINIRLTPDDIVHILEHSRASLLLVDRDLASLYDEVRRRMTNPPAVLWLTGVPDGHDEPLYDDLLAQASPEPPPALSIEENDVAEIFYTSGTTGRPKGVMLTHRNLYLHALQTIICTRATDADVQLHTIPLFHVNGWGTPQGLTAVGGTHVMMRRFDPGEAIQLIEREKVTRFFAVPTMLNMILNHPDVGNHDLSSLSMVMTGGAPTPPEMLRKAQEILSCDVVSGYGLSETSPVLTLATDKSYLEGDQARILRRASTGLPVIGVDLSVVDDNGTAVPWDGTSAGEILVRSNVVMKGYWEDDEATDGVMVDGWFHTGDLAVVDREGYLLIVDRKKDIIISGGENISSVEIEKVLFEHPAVLESAVIGAPDEKWGEIPVALVALKEGCDVSESELISFCSERLASFKVPRRVDFLQTLPKGGTGKILKRELREPYWQGHARRVH